MFRYSVSLLLLSLFVGCIEIPDRLDWGRIVASVGSRNLQVGEVLSALPDGVSGDDSIAFVDLYIERWVHRTVKLVEAERIFTSSNSEIEAMVASYRGSLLMRRLDEYYISRLNEEPFSDIDVELYYRKNMESFKLDHTIVKGRILILPKGSARLTSSSDISSMDRIEGAHYREFSQEWIEYDQFLSMLPIVREQGVAKYLRRSGVQSISSGDSDYHFIIDAYRSEGYTAPFEIVQDEIRSILTTQHRQAIIREREEQLYNIALENGVIKKYID